MVKADFLFPIIQRKLKLTKNVPAICGTTTKISCYIPYVYRQPTLKNDVDGSVPHKYYKNLMNILTFEARSYSQQNV